MPQIGSALSVRRWNHVEPRSHKAHNHPAEVGAATASKISYAIKERALADIFKPASAVVNEVLHLRHYLIKFHKR